MASAHRAMSGTCGGDTTWPPFSATEPSRSATPTGFVVRSCTGFAGGDDSERPPLSTCSWDPGDRGCASRLLRRVAREANADHLTCSFPGGSVQAAAARWTGFLPSPEGLTLVANPLHRLPLDPFTARSWWLTLGDLEVF